MLRQSWAAFRGSRRWAGLKRRYGIDAGVYVVLMPEDDPELNAAALAHVDDLVADRRAQGVVLITGDHPSPAVASDAAGVLATETWTARQFDQLMALYELHSFSDRVLIVSLTRPFGNGLHRLLGRQGLTMEDLVCLGCLRLRSYGMVAT